MDKAKRDRRLARRRARRAKRLKERKERSVKFDKSFIGKVYKFTWPRKNVLTEQNVAMEDQVILHFKRPERRDRLRLEASMIEKVTDERSNKSYTRWIPEKMDELMGLAFCGFEQIEDQEGNPLPFEPATRAVTLQRFFESNMGLDLEEYGALEDECAQWFNKVILRRSDDERKNFSGGPVTDTGGDETSKETFMMATEN